MEITLYYNKVESFYISNKEWKKGQMRDMSSDKRYCNDEVSCEAIEMDKYLINYEENTIRLSHKRNYYNIKLGSIEYIKAYSGETEFKVDEHILRKKISLNDLEKYLDGKVFFRVNKSYVVNIEKITDYKDDIIFIRDKKIPVSRRRKKEFEKIYMEYRLKDCIVT